MSSMADDMSVRGSQHRSGEMETGQRSALLLLGGLLLACVVVYLPTYSSIVLTWARSNTFVHGFLIVPISVFLVWRRRAELEAVAAAPWLPGLLAVFAMSLAWWVSDLLHIQVGKQFASVGMIAALVLVAGGRDFVRVLAFPLGYLVFAVPFGEGAIPTLIDFTATFTVEALQLTGFPVLREGPFFSIPAGDFEVARACSGIRYLLASLAVGTLYAYLAFSGLRKRLAFMLFALVFPIFANGLRAYGIVLLAHFSDMRLAVGVDHLLFGWLFFGIVMLIMFWVGDRFRDQPLGKVSANRKGSGPETPGPRPSVTRIGVAGAFALALVAAGPAFAVLADRMPAESSWAGLPRAFDGFRLDGSADPQNWSPEYRGASQELTRSYAGAPGRITLAVVGYDRQEQGAELINSANQVADPRDWTMIGVDSLRLELQEGGLLPVNEWLLRRGHETRLIWEWRQVNGEPAHSDLAIKLREAASLLTWQQPRSAAVFLSVVVEEDTAASREFLRDLVPRLWKPLQSCLDARAGSDTVCVRPEAATLGTPNDTQPGAD